MAKIEVHGVTGKAVRSLNLENLGLDSCLVRETEVVQRDMSLECEGDE